MKTILSISGHSFLIPQGDVAKLLDCLKSAVPVNHQFRHSKVPGREYDEDCGYARAEVLETQPAVFRVEVVRDENVLTLAEWDELCAAAAAREMQVLAEMAKQPKAVLPGAA